MLITLVTYAFYGIILGLCIAPALAFMLFVGLGGVAPLGLLNHFGIVGAILYVSVCLGLSLYVFLISAVIVMGLVVRLLSLGIGPGRYPQASFTVLRWLIFSGIITLAYALVLPLIPMTFFSTLFFRLIGCKIGKNVWINSKYLNDAYLIELGDDVTIGGNAEISCHLYEDGHLILDRVKIGARSLVGANAYISPGVVIGEDCVVGLGSYIRRGKRLAPGSRYTTIGGMPMRSAAALEKHRRHIRSGV